MDPATPYYYALSTLAQVAAALIGLPGLWRLDRLWEQRVQVEQPLRWLLHGVRLRTEEMMILYLLNNPG